jgi:hypothetical protein
VNVTTILVETTLAHPAALHCDASPQSADVASGRADPAEREGLTVQSVPFHRFRVNNATLGHYLTPDFNGGVALN